MVGWNDPGVSDGEVSTIGRCLWCPWWGGGHDGGMLLVPMMRLCHKVKLMVPTVR